MPVTADSTLWTADTICVTADGRIICIDADAVEAANAFDEIDAAVGANVISATVVEAADAVDELDAAVISRIVALGAYYRQPAAVIGAGFGILPPLRGEAFGTVGVAGDAVGTLSISGDARGEVDDDLLEIVLLMLAA